MRAYINAHPDSACINEGRTAFERMRNHVVVVRRESRDGEPGGESWSYPRPTKVFAVDRSRQSDVEEFLGKGVPVSLDTPSTGNALQWRAEFYRGEWLPRNCPLQYGGFPVKPLTLIFDGDGTLSEISGDGGMFALF